MNFNKFTSGSFLKKGKSTEGRASDSHFFEDDFLFIILTQTTINHAMHINVVVALSSLNILHAPADAVSRNE